MPSKTWSNFTDPTWRGNSQAIKYVLPPLFLVSLSLFAVSLSFYIDLRSWPIDNGGPRYIRPSATETFFYTTFMPLTTTLAHLTCTLLHRTHRLLPSLTIIYSIVAFAGWIYTLLSWGTCEYSSDMTGDGICARLYVYDETEGSLYGYDGSGRYFARVVLGTLACVGEVVVLGLAGEAVERGRRMRLSVHTCEVCCGERRALEGKGERGSEERV